MGVRVSITGTSFSVLPSSDCSPRTSSVGATPRPCSVARSVVPAAETTRCSSNVNSVVGRKRTCREIQGRYGRSRRDLGEI